MMRRVILEYSHQDLCFSAGHFAIFTSDKRESLHGHNYRVYAELTVEIGPMGLNFDCRDYQKIIQTSCQQLDLTFLLPGKSSLLQIESRGEQYDLFFNNEKFSLLKKDVTVLPIANISIEELSHWFLDKLLEDRARLKKDGIVEVVIKISSYPGIAAVAKISAI